MTRHIGIEISSTAVRVAEIRAGDRPKLIAYAERELPHGANGEGGVLQPDVVHNAIVGCLSKGHFRRRHFGSRIEARIGITGLRAITREFEMPRVSDAELDDAVSLQALDIIPFPIERSVLSARRIEEVEGAAVPTDRILLAAAHRDLVEPIVDVVTASGIVVLGVDFAPFALVRALADREGGPEAIVSIGANRTTVVIHDRGEPRLVRTVSDGGSTVTRAIASALDIPFSDAEAMKIRLGVEGDQERIPVEAKAAARDSSMALLGEIRSSIQYYATQHDDRECRRVVLTGGGSLLAGLRERLQHQVQLPIIERGCLDRFVLRHREAALRRDVEAAGAVVIGTALPPSGVGKAIDLLPPELPAERRYRRVERRVAAASAVGLLGLGAVGAHRFVEVRHGEQLAVAGQQSVRLLEGQITKYDEVAATRQAILGEETIGQSVVAHEVNWPAVLQAIDKYTPSGVSAGGFVGSSTAPVTATSVTEPAQPTTAGSSPNAVLGSVDLTFTGPAYPAFRAWFNSTAASQLFTIVQFSGVSDAGKGITFSAQLAITGRLHSDRLTEFETGGAPRGS